MNELYYCRYNKTGCKEYVANVSITNVNGPVFIPDACKYDYDGTGLLYQLVAGPLFNNIYIIAGVFLGFAADLGNRKVLLVISLVWWSVMTGLTGLTHKYWQLALLRFSVAIGYVFCCDHMMSHDVLTELQDVHHLLPV